MLLHSWLNAALQPLHHPLLCRQRKCFSHSKILQVTLLRPRYSAQANYHCPAPVPLAHNTDFCLAVRLRGAEPVGAVQSCTALAAEPRCCCTPVQGGFPQDWPSWGRAGSLRTAEHSAGCVQGGWVVPLTFQVLDQLAPELVAVGDVSIGQEAGSREAWWSWRARRARWTLDSREGRVSHTLREKKNYFLTVREQGNHTCLEISLKAPTPASIPFQLTLM